ncbi:MAG: HAMP domain-containing histidine kinase [Timaviella obliquedivisa GSE-PSE-MK23-08B]|nr:HAMP domain-containing histidine kinase [Timaviella obliquedivisa GSE-PSE-MK23-08B]
MAVLGFLLGLTVGIGLLLWQRSRFNLRLRVLARKLGTDVEDNSLSPASQVGIAIAQMKEVQYHLEQKVEIYWQTLQRAPIGYLKVDDENRLMESNLQARTLLGIDEESRSAKPRLLLELVRSYELDDLIDQARNVDRRCQQDWMFYSVSNDPAQLSEQQSYALRGYAFPLMEGQVGIFLENRQESLTLMQQRDRWASDLAHELKTPLTSIRLVAETLQTRVDPALRTWIDRLIQETIRLSTLVQDLLDLSQVDQNSFQGIQLQPNNLVDLIYSVWHSLEPLARRKGVQIDYRGPTQLWMPMDTARIHRLLVNLLDNSIKFSHDYQHICVKVQVEDALKPSQPAQVCLEVIDSGSGFPEAALPHVFERFYRADPSRSRQVTLLAETTSDMGQSDRYTSQPDLPSGSGLGLAIARQIVEIHQGSITASNHPQTGGAWLQVRLPMGSSDSLHTLPT